MHDAKKSGRQKGFEEENRDPSQTLGSEKSERVGIHSSGWDMYFPLGKNAKVRPSGINIEGERLSTFYAAGIAPC